MTPPPNDMPFRPNPDLFDNGNSSQRERSQLWAARMNSMNDMSNAALMFMSEPQPAIVLLQDVIDRGEKTDEGTIVEAVKIAWYEIVDLMLKDPKVMYQIDPWKLEELIAGAYDLAGADVRLTPRSGDGGRDVIARFPGFSICIFDQVKRYKQGSVVTLDEVSSMLGTLARYPNVSKGYVTTTSTFAPWLEKKTGIKEFIPHRLELRDGPAMLKWLQEESKNKKK